MKEKGQGKPFGSNRLCELERSAMGNFLRMGGVEMAITGRECEEGVETGKEKSFGSNRLCELGRSGMVELFESGRGR
jgi:hypothetical protein